MKDIAVGRAKEIIVKPIAAKDANRIIKSLHYSGKVVQNSQVHLGIFLDGKCGGALQFGPSLDKRKLIGLVRGTKWNEFIELNRLALADWLPRNGESRALGYAMRWLKKTYPWLQWVVSFADATQCGDGTIYRASGFILAGIKKNNQLWQSPNDDARFSRISLTDNSSHMEQAKARTHSASLRPGIGAITTAAMTGGGSSMRAYIDAGFRPLPGFQLRYIYFLDPTARERLTVPILPFSEIERRGAGMYRGKPKRAVSETIDTLGDQPREGGEAPTTALQESL